MDGGGCLLLAHRAPLALENTRHCNGSSVELQRASWSHPHPARASAPQTRVKALPLFLLWLARASCMSGLWTSRFQDLERGPRITKEVYAIRRGFSPLLPTSKARHLTPRRLAKPAGRDLKKTALRSAHGLRLSAMGAGQSLPRCRLHLAR